LSSYYGIVFPEFWTGPTGRELRKHGKDAQLIGLYLATNRHANMIGLYQLLADDIRHETGFGLKGIAKALDAIARTEYAIYDAPSAYVWVRNMARFRLGLKPGDCLVDGDRGDKRVMAVNRLYHGIDPNPFLGDFYDVNRRMLRLTKRREGAGLVVSLTEHHYMSPLPSPLEAPCKPVNRIRDQDQDQVKAAASPRERSVQAVENPRDNVAVITRVAHDVIAGSEYTDFPSLKEDLKQRCRDLGISWDPEVMGGALESALSQRARKRA
jgi:hypothetical protein